jgi:hypothetical protein
MRSPCFLCIPLMFWGLWDGLTVYSTNFFRFLCGPCHIKGKYATGSSQNFMNIKRSPCCLSVCIPNFFMQSVSYQGGLWGYLAVCVCVYIPLHFFFVLFSVLCMSYKKSRQIVLSRACFVSYIVRWKLVCNTHCIPFTLFPYTYISFCEASIKWRLRSSGLQYCVVQRKPNILEEHSASIFRVEE